VQPHAQSGALRPLAVASPSRIALFPDLPTLAEAGVPGILAENWYGLYAPAGTPAPIVIKAHHELMTALKDADVRQKLTAQGAEVRGTTPEEAAAFVAAETTKWARVVKEAGVTLD
jgi:tripartite-type tricarboxylate transporter receptor subunit TctC